MTWQRTDPPLKNYSRWSILKKKRRKSKKKKMIVKPSWTSILDPFLTLLKGTSQLPLKRMSS
jgi:hypothetical protein